MADIDIKKSLLDLIGETIKSQWDEVALQDYGTDVVYKYKDVFRNVKYIHHLLEHNNVKKGDKVAIWDKNSSNWAIIYLGIYSYGAVAVPLLADFNINQIQDLLNHSESKVMFAGKSNVSFDNVSVFNIKSLFNNIDFPEMTKDDVRFDSYNPDDLAVISYTSGSTGNPKGVMIPHRALWSNVVYGRTKYTFLTAKSNVISMLPMAHMFGQAFEFLFPLSVGCRIHVITRIPSPRIILQAFAEIQPLLVVTVPLIIEKIIRGRVFPLLNKQYMKVLTKIPGVKKMIYSKICNQLTTAFGGQFKEIIFGGAGVSHDIEDFLKQIKFRYTIGYGMTECAPLICYVSTTEHKKRSCGKVVDRMEIKILSDDPQNKEGEIVCRGTNVMLGYYKNQEATEEAIDAEGWLHTGDLGTIDSDGFLYIRGRKKNMLLGSNGQNIYPEELENKVIEITNVDECVVVQRNQKLFALVYISDKSLEEKGYNKEQFVENLNNLKRTLNDQLPKYAPITGFELQEKEFEKTPKKSIKRFLYS